MTGAAARRPHARSVALCSNRPLARVRTSSTSFMSGSRIRLTASAGFSCDLMYWTQMLKPCFTANARKAGDTPSTSRRPCLSVFAMRLIAEVLSTSRRTFDWR